MIYARGTTMWHGVRSVGGDRITTLCGRRITEPRLAGRTPWLVCRSCEAIIARSGAAVAA